MHPYRSFKPIGIAQASEQGDAVLIADEPEGDTLSESCLEVTST